MVASLTASLADSTADSTAGSTADSLTGSCSSAKDKLTIMHVAAAMSVANCRINIAAPSCVWRINLNERK